jgi:hypothetical protein
MVDIRASVIELAEYSGDVLAAPPTPDGIEVQCTEVQVDPLLLSCLAEQDYIVTIVVGLCGAEHELQEEAEV